MTPAALPHPVSAAKDATPTDTPIVATGIPRRVEAQQITRSMQPSDREQQAVEEERLAADLAQKEARRREAQARAAHEKALQRAAAARTVAERRLASQLAAVQELGVRLAEAGRRLAARRATQAESAHARIQRQAMFFNRGTDLGLTGPQALDLFRDLDRALGTAHLQMRGALAVSGRSTELPAVAVQAGERPSDTLLATRHTELLKALAEVQRQHAKLRAMELRMRRVRARDVASEVLRLGRIRSHLVGRLTPHDRAELIGLGHRGLQAMRREVTHTSLVLQWTPLAWREIISPTDDDAGIETIGTTTAALGQLFFVLMVWLFLRSRWRRWLEAAGPWLAGEVHNVALRELVSALLRVLHALGDELLLVTVIHAIGNLMVGDATPPELAALYAVAVTYAWYRLILQATHRYLRSAARLRGVDLTAAAEARIISSLRLAGRYSFAVVAAMVFIEHVVGEGFLVTWLRRFFWLGALVVLGVLLRQWRDSIALTYLDNFPNGRLAEFVRSSQGTAAGTAAAVAAFGYVAVRGVTLYLRDLAMRFEHTRRMLAYLFRLRLERHGDRLGTGGVDLGDLPPALVSAFSDPSPEPPPLVPVWPGMDVMVDATSSWLGGGPAPDALVFGPTGVGRSTWLSELGDRIARLDGVGTDWHLHRIDLSQRLTSEAALCRTLSTALGLPEVQRSKELIAALRDGPKRMILVDDMQAVVLRSMDGLAGLRSFAEVIVGSLEHTLWVCTCSSMAWRFASSVMRGRNVFARTLELPSWSEEQIRDLVISRMQRAAVEPVYGDLVIDQLDTGLAEGLRAAERFHRLLWDHADGNPREAMRVWLKSLVPDTPQRVRVRLFTTADPDELEKLGALSRFVLAAIVMHDYTTVDEASRALGEPARDCRMTLAWLVTQGYVDEEHGKYTVNEKWHRASVRYLKRKHLAFD